MNSHPILVVLLLVLIVIFGAVVCVRPPVQSAAPLLPQPPVDMSPSNTIHPIGSGASGVDFYHTIIDNDLFRPLGFRPAIPSQPYRLVGTRIGLEAKAFILDTRTTQLFRVRAGEKIGDVILKQIEAKRVILEAGNKEIQLKLGTRIFH